MRGNPRTGKLHGFESSNIKQRRCAEGDREAVSSSPGAACSTVAMALRGSSFPRPPPRKARDTHAAEGLYPDKSTLPNALFSFARVSRIKGPPLRCEHIAAVISGACRLIAR